MFVVALLPMWWLKYRFARPALEIWAETDELVFEFKDAGYAREFEALNVHIPPPVGSSAKSEK